MRSRHRNVCCSAANWGGSVRSSGGDLDPHARRSCGAVVGAPCSARSEVSGARDDLRHLAWLSSPSLSLQSQEETSACGPAEGREAATSPEPEPLRGGGGGSVDTKCGGAGCVCGRGLSFALGGQALEADDAASRRTR